MAVKRTTSRAALSGSATDYQKRLSMGKGPISDKTAAQMASSVKKTSSSVKKTTTNPLISSGSVSNKRTVAKGSGMTSPGFKKPAVRKKFDY